MTIATHAHGHKECHGAGQEVLKTLFGVATKELQVSGHDHKHDCSTCMRALRKAQIPVGQYNRRYVWD